MTIRAFAPIAVVLDSEFAQLDTNKIEFEGRIGNKRKVFVTEGKVDDTWRTAKYIFFYTNGGLIGKEAHREGGSTTTVSTGTATVTNVPVLPVVFLRSATGHLKFEISQVNQKDSSSAKPSEGIVKSVQTATKIDRKTFSMSLPIGWKEDKKDDMYNPDSTVFFENPEPCLFLVIIRKKSAGASVDSLLTAQKSSWQSKFTDTKIMDISKWANYEGKGFEIEGKFQGIRLSRSRIFGFENADKVSIIIEFAALNDFKTCASDYEEIRQTFKLK